MSLDSNTVKRGRLDPSPEFIALFNDKYHISHPTTVSVNTMKQLIFTKSVNRKGRVHNISNVQIFKVVKTGEAIQHEKSVLCTLNDISVRIVPHETLNDTHIVVDVYRKEK